MKLGMVGLGKMGGNMSRRLAAGGHRVVAFDPQESARRQVAGEGVETVSSLSELVDRLEAPRVVWMMVPAGKVVEAVLAELVPLLAAGDVVVDGGNSFYKDTVRRAAELAGGGIHYVDSGTSGGVWGLEGGYSLMVGGEPEAVARVEPALRTLAPGEDRGWGHVGPPGAGHFVKMVHNGIEYGLMQAYAEGFAILERKEDFGLDLAQVAEIWRHGSVVRSWLLDLLAGVLAEDAGLEGVAPWVADSGEGRWTAFEAIELDTPAPVITLSLIQRLRSRDTVSYPDRLLAALRNAFGGHAIRESGAGGADGAVAEGEPGAGGGSPAG